MNANKSTLGVFLSAALLVTACSKGSGPQDGDQSKKAKPSAPSAPAPTTTKTVPPPAAPKSGPATDAKTSGPVASTPARGAVTPASPAPTVVPAPNTITNKPVASTTYTIGRSGGPAVTSIALPEEVVSPEEFENSLKPKGPTITAKLYRVTEASPEVVSGSTIVSSQPTRQTPSAPTSATQDVKNKEEEPKGQTYSIDYIYVNEMKSFTDTRGLETLQALFKGMDLSNVSAVDVIPDRQYYNTPITRSNRRELPQGLADGVENSSSCFVSGAGGCIVLEKLSAHGISEVRAYNLVSAPENRKDGRRIVVRNDVNRKLVAAGSIERLLLSKPDGIYVFSRAVSARQAFELADKVYAEIQAEKAINKTAYVPVIPKDKLNGMLTAIQADDIAQADKIIGEIAGIVRNVKEARNVNPILPGCWIKAKLGPTHGVFLIGGGLQLVKEGRGQVFCRLSNGTVQMPKVIIQQYRQWLQVGLELNKLNVLEEAKNDPRYKDNVYDQYFFATGLGSLRTSIDIIKVGKFRYPLQIDAAIPFGGISFMPLVLRMNDNVAALAVMISGIAPGAKVRGSVGIVGKFEIKFDPDES